MPDTWTTWSCSRPTPRRDGSGRTEQETAFGKIKYEVERKVRRLAAKKCKRKGFGWKRWSSAVVYGTWGLFRDYRVVYWSAKACPN
jgi:hypothetical protein